MTNKPPTPPVTLSGNGSQLAASGSENQLPSPTSQGPPGQSGTEQPGVSRRGNFYCQKRKIRCSGLQPCGHCRNPDECKYPDKRRKPRAQVRASELQTTNRLSTSSEGNASEQAAVGDALSGPQDQAQTQNQGPTSTDAPAVDPIGHAGSHYDHMASRLSRLEQSITSITNQPDWTDQLAFSPSTLLGGPHFLEYGSHQFLPPLLGHSTAGPNVDFYGSTPEQGTAGHEPRAGPSLAKSIDAIESSNKLIAETSPSYPECSRGAAVRCVRGDEAGYSPCCERDLALWASHSKTADVANLRAHFRTFFDGPNTHYPCVNEPFFQSWFESLLNSGSAMPRNPDSMQFVALVNLIVAVVEILGENTVENAERPGWAEFSRADHLLSHVLWFGNASYLSIQCLITKASYLLYIEKAHLAYDAVGTATRIMYQTGLHDQRGWKHCSEFETAMCQRVFWSLYCLDRAIALASGAPCIIQDATVNVDLPVAYDDRQLLPGATLPDPSPTSSSVPYLQQMVHWAHLYSDTCKTVLENAGMGSMTTENFEALDQKILGWFGGLPAHLTWSPEIMILDQTNSLPHFILRQSVVLLLRGNYLRLLIRQEDVIHRQYRSEAATACVNIASSSIDVVHLLHYSFLHRPVERYSSVTFLAGAMIPLICVILRDRPGSDLFTSAIEPFRKALAIIQGLAPTFSYARHTLVRFRPNLALVNKRIEVAGASPGLSRGLQQQQGHTSTNGVGRHDLSHTGGNTFSASLDELLQGQMMPSQFPMGDVGVNGMLG